MVIARYKENNLLYALKFIDKQKIRKFNGENSILTEKDVLECVYHPGIITLFATF